MAVRTTMDIDDSVLAAVKELARREGKSAGEMMSVLLRQALTQGPPRNMAGEVREAPAAYGFRPFAAGEALVTNESIDKLRDELGV